MSIQHAAPDVESELQEQIAANGELFTRWLNGEIRRDDITVVTELFSPDAIIVNSRLPNITASREEFDGVMMAWWGIYSEDPVRSTVELRSSLDLGAERYLTVHVRHLQNSKGITSNPETTLFVRNPAVGGFLIQVVAE